MSDLNVRDINFIIKRIMRLDAEDLEYVVYKINRLVQEKHAPVACAPTDLGESVPQQQELFEQ